MNKTIRGLFKVGDRVVVVAGLNKGIHGEIKFIELGIANPRIWVLRDGVSNVHYYYDEDLDFEDEGLSLEKKADAEWKHLESILSDNMPISFVDTGVFDRFVGKRHWETLGIDKWDYRFLRMAREVASWSKDPSTQVGACLVSPDKRKVAHGYNGFARDMEDRPEWYSNREEKYSRIIHGEINAKDNAAEMGVTSLEGWTLYTWPFLSCDRCFVQIQNRGVARFVAPIIPAELIPRWGPVAEKVRTYVKELQSRWIDVRLDEIPFPTTFPEEIENV